MKTKTRTIRTAKTAAAAAVAPALSAEEQLIRRRRAFFEPLLVSVSALRADQLLPQDMIREIIIFARAHNSDFALAQMVDGTAGEARLLLEELLSLPNLQAATLSHIIPRFLQDLRARKMAAAYGYDDDKDMSSEEKILFRLRQYVQKNLTAYLPELPVGQKRIDTPIEKIEEDLAKLFPIENRFYPLFLNHTLIPESVKEFLATSDFMVGGELDIRRAIQHFIRARCFDRVHRVLAEHKIDGPSSWEAFLSKEYMAEFPRQLWRLTTSEQFEKLETDLRQTSIPMEGLIDRLLLQTKTAAESSVVRRTMGRMRTETPNLMRLKNHGEMEIFYRTRPDIPGFQTLLVRPLEEAVNYAGAMVSEDGYAIPTDAFYRDLVTKDVEQEGLRLVIRDEDRMRVMNVAHQMRDGRIIPQTREMFLASQRYMEKRAAEKLVAIPQIAQILLDTPLGLLSVRDLDALRKDARDGLIRSLTLPSGCALAQSSAEFLAMAIEEGIFDRDIDVDDYLSRLFPIIVLVDPRYAYHLLSPAIHLRIRLGFYRPAEMARLPASLVFPDYPGLSASKQADYDAWIAQGAEHFCRERIVAFLIRQYPFLRASSALKRSHSMPPRSLLSTPRRTESLLVLYHGSIPLFLDVLATSILNGQEFLVDGKALDPAFLEELRQFLDLDRVQYGLSAPETEMDIVPVIDFPSEDPTEESSLPDFKKTAMDLLDHL